MGRFGNLFDDEPPAPPPSVAPGIPDLGDEADGLDPNWGPPGWGTGHDTSVIYGAPQTAPEPDEPDDLIPDEVEELLDDVEATVDAVVEEAERAQKIAGKLAALLGVREDSAGFKTFLAASVVAALVWAGISLDRQGIVDWVPWPDKPPTLEIDNTPQSTTTTVLLPSTLAPPTTIDLSGLTPETTTTTMLANTSTTTTALEQLPETSEGALSDQELTFAG